MLACCLVLETYVVARPVIVANAFHSNIFLSILPALYYVEICEALTDNLLLLLLSVSMLSVNATLTQSWRHCCPCFGLSMDCCTWRDVSLSPSDTSLYIGCRCCRFARFFCLYTTAVRHFCEVPRRRSYVS